MTGLDFSPAALAQARALAERTGAAVDFVESDVYAAADVLGEGGFDLVFTGIGALCWLPDVRRWAAVVRRLLRPGGRLFLREGHPMLWSLADVGRTVGSSSSTPTSSGPSPRCGTRTAPTSRPTPRSATTGPWSGTTGSARSSPLCSTRGCG